MGFMQAIREHGIIKESSFLKYLDNQVSEKNTSISKHVIWECLQPYNKTIKNLYDNKKSWIGPGPLDQDLSDSKIHAYLQRHSIRNGFSGKLAGIVYRMIESFKHVILGKSDKYRALDEIEDFLFQAEKIRTGTYRTDIAVSLGFGPKTPDHIKVCAKLILNRMLTDYNIIVAAN